MRLVLEIRHGERGEQLGHERLTNRRGHLRNDCPKLAIDFGRSWIVRGHEVQRLRAKYTAAPLSENSIIRPVAINETRSAELIGTPRRLK